MESSSCSPTASVPPLATREASATASCRCATASRGSRASIATSARPDFLDRRVNCAPRVATRPGAHLESRIRAASREAGGAGASATRGSPALEVARASRSILPAPGAAREDAPRARSRARRKTDYSTKPSASRVRRGTEATTTTIASSATGMSTQLLAPTYARHAPRATFRLREQESAVRVTLERIEVPPTPCAPSAIRTSIQLAAPRLA